MKECESLISIIVPIYNVEKYLKKCIDSLINQTYKNIEIILVDDESPDNCGRICDEYARLDNRIRVIHQNNSGVGKARENGMDIALGKYLTFVDSDDWIEPDFCERMLEKLLSNNADWIACNAKELDENGKEINDFNNIETEELIKDNETLFAHYFEGKNYTRVVWGKLFKTSKIKGREFQKLKICEDTCFMFDLFTCNLEVVLAEYYGYNYVRRGNSVTSKKRFRVEDFDYLKGLVYIKNIIKGTYPKYLEEVEKQRIEALVNMYISLLTEGTENEIRKYKDTIKKQIINRSGQSINTLKKHVYMIKYLNHVYDCLICFKCKKK